MLGSFERPADAHILLTYKGFPAIKEEMAIRRCPYCKAIIDESQKYCNNCGTQLLFPEDELTDEPVKGEKIVDEDFRDKDEDENEAGSPLESDDAHEELEREDIDLEEVLEGAGHFPGDANASKFPIKKKADVPAKPPEVEEKPPSRRAPAAPRRAPARSAKKAAEPTAEHDTKEEIARLIAALDEKERAKSAENNLEAGAERRGEPRENAPEPYPGGSSQEGPKEPAPWQDFLDRPVPTSKTEPVDVEIPIPSSGRVKTEDFGPLREADDSSRIEKPVLPDADEEPDLQAPAESYAPGDTMDFQDEIFSRTPAPDSPPASTNIGIPERITREDLFTPREDDLSESSRGLSETPFRSLSPSAAFPEFRPSTAKKHRPGFFRRTIALIFDVLFIAVLWTLSIGLAAKLMAVPPIDLVLATKIPMSLYFLVLLGGYYFLFLFFLGETLGDRLVAPRS